MSESFDRKILIGKEAVDFEPRIIFDFIRHGQAEYGAKLKEKMESLGYKWGDVLPTSVVADDIENPADMEGRITEKGERQLREAAKKLAEKIDKDNELVMIFFGPRSRTVFSADIFLDELGKQGVNVVKAREHEDLIDMKKHWIALLEFIKIKAPEAENVFSYWLKMSEEEIHEADLESFNDIGKRTSHFTEVVKRYARRYSSKSEGKRLRVVSVTSDANILAMLSDQGVPPEKSGMLIANAQIVELGVDADGNNKLLD